jgi:class 3 adenylate cyclase
MLNDLFSAVVQTATSEGGWLHKFEGAAALCIFGAPKASHFELDLMSRRREG